MAKDQAGKRLRWNEADEVADLAQYMHDEFPGETPGWVLRGRFHETVRPPRRLQENATPWWRRLFGPRPE